MEEFYELYREVYGGKQIKYKKYTEMGSIIKKYTEISSP